MERLPHHDAVDHMASVTRIAWLNGAFGAADEIERLRKERDELQKWKDAHNTFWRDRAERRDAMREAADEIERLRAERDEARRKVCEMSIQRGVFRRVGGKTVEITAAEGVADMMQWDCFKEEQ
jgi:hypothetical protein